MNNHALQYLDRNDQLVIIHLDQDDKFDEEFYPPTETDVQPNEIVLCQIMSKDEREDMLVGAYRGIATFETGSKLEVIELMDRTFEENSYDKFIRTMYETDSGDTVAII